MFDINIALNDYDAFMEFTNSLETLRLVNNNGLLEYVCFLKNHPAAASHFYGRSHGVLSLNNNSAYVFLCINSIDDGSIVLMGPTETKEESMRRIELLVNEINSWGGWIPTAEQCHQVEKSCGMYWNR